MTNPTWTTAMPDWSERIIAGQSIIPVPPLFPDEAAAAMDVFSSLRISDMAGQPTFGETARPWVMDFAGSLFGSYNPETGRRLVEEYLLLVAKKNTKSTLAAGIMLTVLLRNWRHDAEYLILAPTIEVANNSFLPAWGMVKADPELDEILHVQSHYRTITHRTTGATLKVVAAEADAVSGKKATGVLVDELWLFGRRADAEAMLMEATGGLASRPEGFVCYLSTQSDAPPAGVFAQKLRYGREVRDGNIDDNRFMPVIYEHPPQMIKDGRHKDKSTFYIPNPNLGASVDIPYLERKFDQALTSGDATMSVFMAKNLNVEIGVGLRTDRWAGADLWAAAGKKDLSLGELIARSEVITAGIDGGGLDDMLALSFVGRCRKTQHWLAWTHCWVSEQVLEIRREIAPLLRDLAQVGDLTIVPQMGPDITDLAERCRLVHRTGKLPQFGVDAAGIGLVVDALAAHGIAGDAIVGVPQGWPLSGAIKTVERKLADGTLEHAAQPIQAWCVGNAKIEPRGNAVLITKAISGKAKIDGLMSLLDAAFLMARNPAASEGMSALARRGIITT